MPARHLVRGDAETLPRHAALKLGRKKPIIASNEDARRHGGPALEVTRACKNGIRLSRLTLRPGFVNHGLWHVMKELDQRIKWGAGFPPITSVLPALRLAMA